MNSVVLIGRLTKNPDIRYGEQSMVANFTLAIDRQKKQDGTKETDFPRIVCFGKTAEIVERNFGQGQRVAIEGRIQTGSYTNREGQKVYTTDVVANRVEIIDWPERQANGTLQEQGYNAPQGTTTFASGNGFGQGYKP